MTWARTTGGIYFFLTPRIAMRRNVSLDVSKFSFRRRKGDWGKGGRGHSSRWSILIKNKRPACQREKKKGGPRQLSRSSEDERQDLNRSSSDQLRTRTGESNRKVRKRRPISIKRTGGKVEARQKTGEADRGERGKGFPSDGVPIS